MMQRAIESVFTQTYPVDELIVVDDGSTDDTWLKLQQLTAVYPNLVIVKHDRARGACAARNTAINRAKCDFITGIDDDDEWLPNHIDNLFNIWDGCYSCVAASLLNDNGKTRKRQGKESGQITLDAILHYNRLGNQVLTKTARMREINGFDESLPAFQDYDCWVRLIDKFGPAKKSNLATYVLHTAHELERISSNPERKIKALKLFVEKHKSLFTEKHLRSAELTEKRLLNHRFTLSQLFHYCCFGNYRAILSALRTNLKAKT